MRAAAVILVVALAGCAADDSESAQMQSCLDEIDALYEERAEFFERSVSELAGITDEGLERESLTDQGSELNAPGSSADFTTALGQLAARMESMPLEDMEPFMEFMADLELRENRIQIAIRRCPAALERLNIDPDQPAEVVL